MAPFGHIYSYPGNFRLSAAQVAGAFNGLEVEAAPNFEMGKTNKTPEFLAKFPLGKVPTFEGADGFCLSESIAIAQYLAASGPKASQLLGSDAKAQGLVQQWIAFGDAELRNAAANVGYMTLYKFKPFSQADFDTNVASLTRALKRLEAAVSGGNKFLVGEAVSMADIMVFAPLHWAHLFLIDAEMRAEFPGVAKYLDGLAGLPEFSKYFGPINKLEKRVTA